MTVKVFGNLVRRTYKNERKFQIFVQETGWDFFPRPLRKPLYKMYLKEILMDKYGPEAFLFPETMLFPVVNINTGQVDNRLIQYAVIRGYTLCRISSDFNYILEKALKFFEEHNGKESIVFTLVDEQRQLTLIEFLRYLHQQDGKMKFEIPDDINEGPKPNPHKKPWHASRFKRLDKTATKKF